jgi:ribonuclease P protein component
MLSNEHRFHGPNSLRYVYKNGQTVHSHLFNIKHVTNDRREKPRFAVVVSKKVHKSAVGRNRIRRRLYEIIRHQLPRLHPDRDIVVIVVSGDTLAMGFSEMTQTIEQLFSEAGLYK